MSAPENLVSLTRKLGDPAADLAILAEGNSSTWAVAGETFWVKASGLNMGSITASGFVEVRAAPLLEALKRTEPVTDEEVKSILKAARVDQEGERMPSVETFMHAALLSLPEVSYVGHTHPVALLPILCLPEARMIAAQRLFPDEIVCCGPAACYVSYRDPGLPLAQEIDKQVRLYIDQRGEFPKTIWLANHGLIALGRTPSDILSATFMSAKAAKVWMAAIQWKEPFSLSPQQVARIATRPDEHYRQRLLSQE